MRGLAGTSNDIGRREKTQPAWSSADERLWFPSVSRRERPRARGLGAGVGGGRAGGERRYAQDGTVLVGVPPPRLALGALLGLGLLVPVAEGRELAALALAAAVVVAVRVVAVDVHGVLVLGELLLNVVLPLLGGLGADEAVDLLRDDGANAHARAGAALGAPALALRAGLVLDEGGFRVGRARGDGEVLREVEHEEERDAIHTRAPCQSRPLASLETGLRRDQEVREPATGWKARMCHDVVTATRVYSVAAAPSAVVVSSEKERTTGGAGSLGRRDARGLRAQRSSAEGTALSSSPDSSLSEADAASTSSSAADPRVDVAGQVRGRKHAAVGGEGELGDAPLVVAEAAQGLVLGDVAAEAVDDAGLLDGDGVVAVVAGDLGDEDLGAVLDGGDPAAVGGQDDLAGAVGGEGLGDGDGGELHVRGLGGVLVLQVEGLDVGAGGGDEERAVLGDGGRRDVGLALDQDGLEELAVLLEVGVHVGAVAVVEPVKRALQLPDVHLPVPPAHDHPRRRGAGQRRRLRETGEGSVVLAAELLQGEDDGGRVRAWGGWSADRERLLTSRNNHAHLAALKGGHGLDVVLVVFPAPDLAPSGAGAGRLLVQHGAAVHAAAQDGRPVSARREAENVLPVALDALHLRVRLAVPDADLAGRVGRDDVAGRQDLDAPHDDVLGTPGQVGTEGHLPQHGAVAHVVGAEGRVGAADDDDVAGLEGDADHLGLFGRGLDEQTLEAEVVVLDRVEGEHAVDGAGDEARDGVVGRGGRLGGQAPDVAVLAAGVAQGAAGREAPFGDGGGVADAEEARAAGDRVLVGLVHPDEAVDGAVRAGAQDGLLVPGAGERVPDLNVAIRAADREAREGGLVLGAGGRVGEGEGVDGGGRVGDEAAAMEIHCEGGVVCGGLEAGRSLLCVVN
ncbi:LOW QUALITY PROTEIN: hypothetical protein Ct61P_09930 [Colletotrichum tofieldiae]|nr:LOW QUALITY PROTEIN: hypothetical protein Ct61P_09930 [Colletotrichum tofieldiae]